MAKPSIFHILCVILLPFLSDIKCFNLDIKVPIVKYGKPDTYFGFSVAQHIIGALDNGIDKPVILVGAPLANITHPSALSQVRSLDKPGTVFKCPITSYLDDCDELLIEKEKPIEKDDKNGQWMGVSISSQRSRDGKAIACAHRFSEIGPGYRWGRGSCTSLTNVLDYDAFHNPCEYKSTNKGHEEFGFCQVGTSSDLSPGGDFMLGSPGPYNWRGAVFKNIIEGDFFNQKKWYLSPTQSPLKNEIRPDPAPAGSNSYLGMSSVICNALGGAHPWYVSGAPRSNDNGQVLMFQQGSDALTIQPEHFLNGEQFGAGFGYSLACVDLNNDGREDLVVGAPFYNEPGHGGAIYIYYNSEKGIDINTKPVKILSRTMPTPECKALNCQNGRFGFSISTMGDLDLDGYKDLVVGAPFEGNGCVYVFRGSDKGLGVEPSQRISASDLISARPLQSFGYSLSGGVDMDENGYPDLVVGAFEQSKALILRSRPVVNIHTTIQAITSSASDGKHTIDPKEDQCPQTGAANNCFDVHVCFRFDAKPKDRFSTKMDLKYKLEAELFTGKQISRVFLKGAEDDSKHMIERNVKLAEQSTGDYKCKTHLVYIVSNNRDFLNPISFQLTYALDDQAPPTMSPGDPVPDINSYPVLNTATAKDTLQVHFEKNCGPDDVCHSKLKVNADFKHLDRDESGRRVFKVGQVDVLRLEAEVVNEGEDAHETTLTILLPPSVSYIGATDEIKQKAASCSLMEDNEVRCAIGNPMTKNQRSRITIRINGRNLNPTDREIVFRLRVNTTSIESDNEGDTVIIPVNVIVETDMLIRGFSKPTELFYGGEIRGESAVKVEDDIGGEVVHRYEVKNAGTARVLRSTVTIQWPYEAENGEYQSGKHLLYLLEDPVVDGDGQCTIVDRDRYVDPLKIKLPGGVRRISQAIAEANNGTDINRRAKREKIVRDQQIIDPISGKSLKVVIFDCETGSAKCFEIVCQIGELVPENSVVIHLRSRLWNSTFLEDYRDVDQVRIYSTAMVSIDPSFNIAQTDSDNDKAKALTKAIPDLLVRPPKEVPLWVIIVAAIGGLLLLIILIVLLWKCGFFKRNVPDDMRQHKAKKEKASYHEDAYN